jgi:hypothetical protein
VIGWAGLHLSSNRNPERQRLYVRCGRQYDQRNGAQLHLRCGGEHHQSGRGGVRRSISMTCSINVFMCRLRERPTRTSMTRWVVGFPPGCRRTITAAKAGSIGAASRLPDCLSIGRWNHLLRPSRHAGHGTDADDLLRMGRIHVHLAAVGRRLHGNGQHQRSGPRQSALCRIRS